MAFNNLYLHFLDRELRGSVGWDRGERTLLRALFAAICLARGTVFCSYSHLWESFGHLPNSQGLMQTLTQGDFLQSASGHASAEEFLATRTALYEHDRKRYPMYFRPRIARELLKIQPTQLTKVGATTVLESSLREWVDRPGTSITPVVDQARRLLTKGLDGRRDEAITGSLFSQQPSADVVSLSLIRRRISADYTDHYMRECDADILTGIAGLECFDNLSLNYPLADAGLLRGVFAFGGFALREVTEIKHAIEGLLLDHPANGEFLACWDELMRKISSATPLLPTPASRGAILAGLKQAAAKCNWRKAQQFTLLRATEFIAALSRHVSGEPVGSAAERRGATTLEWSPFFQINVGDGGNLVIANTMTTYKQNIIGSTFTNSPVAIQQMLQNSFNTIEAVQNDQLKKDLLQLTQEVSTLLEKTDEKTSQQIKDDLDTFVREAAKPEPRKKWLDLSGKGLIEAATTVATLAGPIADTVTKIIALFN